MGTIRRNLAGLFLLLMVTLIAGCGGSQATDPSPTAVSQREEQPTATEAAEEGESLSPSQVSEAETLLQDRCAGCHSLDRVEGVQKSTEQWEETMDRMIDLGAELDEEERDLLIAYLVEAYGP